MSRITILRLLESFFRRWWLCLVPVLLLAGLGARLVMGQSQAYRSIGSVNVANSTLVATLTDVRGNPSFGYDTAAGATSKQVNSLLQTDQFLRDVVTRAGLDGDLTSGVLTLPHVRTGLTAWANGPNLLMVSATFTEPATAQKLAASTIDAFVQSVVASSLGDSTAATSFFGGVITQYKADVDTARAAVDTWLKAHPAPGFGRVRSDDELAQLKQLNDALAQATDRYNAALAKNDSARLSAEQTKSDISQRLRVIDTPGLPLAPQSGLKTKILTIALFIALGVLLAGAVVVMGAMADRSVRFPSDVKDVLGVRLLSTVPDATSIPYAPTKAQMLAMGISQPRVLTAPRTPRAKAAAGGKAPAARKAGAAPRKAAAGKPRSTTRAKAAESRPPIEMVPAIDPALDDAVADSASVVDAPIEQPIEEIVALN